MSTTAMTANTEPSTTVTEVMDDETLPLPIQIFLWRQTSPFIRPKFGRQQISTAMEQREACKSLEKVLVQNILFGLSPSLTEAIKSISRWKLIQASLPHVMHCTAALLYNRKLSNFDKLGAAETKLLYTLHWILLDAADECADAELECGIRRPFDHYLLPIPTLELFVYLFAPLTSYLKASDFLSCFRLENGYKIWDAFFNSRHPDIPSFVAHAKPKRDILSAQLFEKKVETAEFGDVFLGDGSDEKGGFDATGKEIDQQQQPQQQQQPASSSSPQQQQQPPATPSTPPVNVQQQQQQQQPPPTPTPQQQSTASKSGSTDDTSKLTPTATSIQQQQQQQQHQQQAQQHHLQLDQPMAPKALKDPLMATYLDVATIRCLLLPQWIEEGVDWALKFILNRLNDIQNATTNPELRPTKCSSLPNLKCDSRRRTTTYLDSSEKTTPPSRRGSTKESKSSHSSHQQSDSPTSGGGKCKSSRKIKRGAEWKVLRKALIFSSHEFLPPRPSSAASSNSTQVDRSSELSRGKSMPSLLLERRSSSVETKSDQETSLSGTSVTKQSGKNIPQPPIITITEHSPVSSIQFFDGPNGPHSVSGLFRSKSDGCISYYSDSNCEVSGSTHYITKDGKLSLHVILKAVHAVSIRDSNSSLRTNVNCVKLLHKLMDMEILEKREKKPRLRKNRQSEPPELNVHQLFIDSIIHILKHLGCPHGCGPTGLRGHSAEKLRHECKELLMQLPQLHVTKYFKHLSLKRPIHEILDIFHAFIGFCSDGGSANRNEFNYINDLSSHTTPEGLIVEASFKAIVTRSVQIQKELTQQENLATFCELRQFLNYTRIAHGGSFRRVALSALIDSADRAIIEPVATTAEYVKSKATPEGEFASDSVVRKRSCGGLRSATSANSVGEGEIADHWQLANALRAASPRLSITDDELAFQARAQSKFGFVNWLKNPSVDQNGRRPSLAPRRSTLTFMKGARKRVEDQFTKFVFGRGKGKQVGSEEGLEMSRRNSLEPLRHTRETEPLRLKLVCIPAIRSGLLRFSFLLEACTPGSLPDPAIMAAVLDIKAPVVARAAFYFEVAHFVHKCNRGQWPMWMKLSIPFLRPGKSFSSARRGSMSQHLQRHAGRSFYQWAEAIGARLEQMASSTPKISQSNLDDTRKRALRHEDDNEDFLDEASIHEECPFALKIAAVQVLFEVTCFLRETHQYLPSKANAVIQRPSAPEHRTVTANRRWSMALSSLGFSQQSAHSLVSLAEEQKQNERRISFVLHEADGEATSLHSSVGSNADHEARARAMTGEKRLSNASPATVPRPHLLRRATGAGSGSFKRRSLKLKKTRNRHRSCTVDDGDGDRAGLGAPDRRVSNISDISGGVSGDESPGVLSDDGQPNDNLPVDTLTAEDTEIVKDMPWVKVVVSLINNLDFDCNHLTFCSSCCYKRQIRACRRLVLGVQKVYDKDDSTSPEDRRNGRHADDSVHRKEKRVKKHASTSGDPFKSPMGDHEVPLIGKRTDDSPDGLKYIRNQVKDLFHSPLSLMLKSTLVSTQSILVEQMALAWELLLEDDQHLASTAGAAFIVAAAKCPDYANELLTKELSNSDPKVRIAAVTKFHIIWRSRFQCWPRMEEGAHMSFKVSPGSIEFTLPSPKIALDTMPIPDPPWMPMVKAKVEEVTISQEQTVQKSFVTATKTRRKQQIEMVQRAIEQEQEKLREEREAFRISAVPINMQAAYEPALFHSTTTGDEHGDEDIEDGQAMPTTQLQMAQAMFPSCLCSAVPSLINLLDDWQASGATAVYEVAYKVIWLCLIEDSSLFLRHLFERLTREKNRETIQIFRRLIRFMPRLPAQAAHTLYNYLIGYVMFCVRGSQEGAQDAIGATLSILWLVVPSVHGLFLKDLKQVLRKEQCDANLLITANVPSAKKIIVYGPEAGGIPSQFPIQEDTQFYQILVDSVDFFGIEESKLGEYYLLDAKSGAIHGLSAYVRDFYFFRRSQYPQLSLVRLPPHEAFKRLQSQAFSLQFLEVGKTLMSLSIVKSNYLAIQRVLFLHEELMKLPSFPRKALEANFSLYKGEIGRVILGMDTLHKIVWIRLVARMFEVTSSFFAQSADIHLFLNVVNGALTLHCEDAAVLRLCMATYINVAHQFKNIFSLNGYLLIMPTVLRIYSNHQSNGLLCRTIEFVCKQLYIMHRKPFLLQMFGSAAPILDSDSNLGDATRIQPLAFFKLLQSMASYIQDPLDILELVEAEKPLKALDFCYQLDPETITIIDSINLCVTVVSYSADCLRSHQMLAILESILPLYLKHIQGMTVRKETPGGPRAELATIHSLSIAIRTLVANCEPLTRNFSGPQRAIDLRGSSVRHVNSPPVEIDDDSHSRFFPDSRKPRAFDEDDAEDIRNIFRRPRDTLLNLVAEFLTRATARLADLSKKIPDLHQKGSSHELLDVKCHLRLAEIAHSLLKIAPYDPQTMGCRGLLRYMTEVLPTSEWRQEAMRPALIVILRRLDKMFTKIAKKNQMRRVANWEAAKGLLKGVYLTFSRHPYIVHLPHLKSLINVCQSMVLGDLEGPGGWTMALNQSPPHGFSSVAVRLIAMQMVQMGESQTLEVICGASLTPEKTEVYLMNLIYPMAIRVSGGLKDGPRLRSVDVSFILSIVLNSLNPGAGTKTKGSVDGQATGLLQSSLQETGFLGLKILLVCFERLLSSEWHRIARHIRDMVAKGIGGVYMWNFLDFVVTYRTPLFILLLPMVRCKLLDRNCAAEESIYQKQIKQKLLGQRLPFCRSRGQLLVYLLAEMKQLREDLVNRKSGTGERKADHSLSHRLSFAISSAFQGGARASVSSPQGSSADPSSPPAVGLTRGWSFRDKPNLPVRGLSFRVRDKNGSRKVVDRFLQRRTSYPYNVEDENKSNDPQAQSDSRLFRRSTLLIKKRGSRKAVASPAKSPEESSLTETIDEEPGKGGTGTSGEDSEDRNRHRLQRKKAQSRRTFRFRKPPEEAMNEVHLDIDETSQLLDSEGKSKDET